MSVLASQVFEQALMESCGGGTIIIYIFTELARWVNSVIESRCPSVRPSVCVWRRKTPSSKGHEDFWSKNLFLILACDDTIVNNIKKGNLFFQYFGLIPPPLLYARKFFFHD